MFEDVDRNSLLRTKRHAFSILISKLMIEVHEENPGWQLVYDELAIHKNGPSGNGRRVVLEGEIVLATDAQHISKSYHYAPGLAADLVLYINAVPVENGSDPAWLYISNKWKSMHPLCSAGIDFGDANHLSFGEGK